jgi:exodeoxyribonuclease VII small subunit
MAASEKTGNAGATAAVLDAGQDVHGGGQGPQGPQGPKDRFDDLLLRLRGVVEKLEGGNLSLEDSLKFFEEGIDLCRRGATILDSAERKVEVLLGGTSGAPRTTPFDAPGGDGD